MLTVKWIDLPWAEVLSDIGEMDRLEDATDTVKGSFYHSRFAMCDQQVCDNWTEMGIRVELDRIEFPSAYEVMWLDVYLDDCTAAHHYDDPWDCGQAMSIMTWVARALNVRLIERMPTADPDC